MSTEEHIEKDLQKAIRLHEQKELKYQFQQLERRGRTRKLAFVGLSIAAVITLLIAFGGIFLMQTPATGEALYAENFQAYPNALKPVTRSIDSADYVMQACAEYEAGNYKAAATAFQKILAEDYDADISFYFAMSLQNMGEHYLALTELHRLEGAPTQFATQALWYRALLEIRLDQRDAASATLQQLLQAKPAYKAAEAQALLEAL